MKLSENNWVIIHLKHCWLEPPFTTIGCGSNNAVLVAEKGFSTPFWLGNTVLDYVNPSVTWQWDIHH